MKITNALIAKFLADRCNEEEAAAVHDYYTAHPELQDTILPETEWNEILTSKPKLSKKETLLIKRKWRTAVNKDRQLPGKDKYFNCKNWKWMIGTLVLLIFILLLLFKLFQKSQKEALLSAVSFG